MAIEDLIFYSGIVAIILGGAAAYLLGRPHIARKHALRMKPDTHSADPFTFLHSNPKIRREFEEPRKEAGLIEMPVYDIFRREKIGNIPWVHIARREFPKEAAVQEFCRRHSQIECRYQLASVTDEILARRRGQTKVIRATKVPRPELPQEAAKPVVMEQNPAPAPEEAILDRLLKSRKIPSIATVISLPGAMTTVRDVDTALGGPIP